ncbi:MAG: proton-conducting transporter membrane subunit [bacterium]|nr:proton-conducting transporter membrane subunit [bacterium]MDY2830966.1 proton-conducting transporter membrane subunit [Alphaproteobacteria bacterium]
MFQNWFILLPEICLILFFPVAWLVNIFREEKTSKTFFSLAQFFLALFLAASVVFYNKSAFPEVWRNTPFSTLFKVFVSLLAWAWFYLSSKWFLNKNRTSYSYFLVVMALMLVLEITVSASSLMTLAVCLPLILVLSCLLISRHWDFDKVKKAAWAYGVSALVFGGIFAAGAAVVSAQAGSLDYAAVKAFLSSPKSETWAIKAAVAAMLSALLFTMALVPFHGWFIAFISNGVLPVCGFMTLVPPLIYLGVLINLMQECFAPLNGFLEPVLTGVAALSLLIGALSANRESNIRRLFAYVWIYGQGLVLMSLTGFDENRIIAAFAYMVIMILAFAGIYTVFLGFKSKGDYLSELREMSGFSQTRPYMSATLMVFMFSLIGLAPTLGFFGYLSVAHNLTAAGDFWRLGSIFVSLLFVANACLQVIRTVYFEQPLVKYDRPDKAIYICLFINAVVILISLINPSWLFRDAFLIVKGIY